MCSAGFFDSAAIHEVLEESVKMKSFSHRNVLNMIGVCLDAGSAPYLLMPYMENGSLLAFLKKERENLLFPEGTGEEEKVNHNACIQACVSVCLSVCMCT